MDLLIKNAITYDFDSGAEKSIALGITGSVITFLCESSHLKKAECLAEKFVDAEGGYILPGLIDFHTHLYTKGSTFGVNGDLLLSSGVTTAVDMGTAGSTGYEGFRQTDILPRTIKIKTFLNLSPLGQPGAGIAEPLSRKVIQEDKIKEIIETYGNEIKGIKVRLSREIVGSEGIGPLEHALEIGERFKLPVCVHTTNPPVTASDIVKRLRPGDIYSHMYHNRGMTILSEENRVQEAFYEAKKRGVYLEVGNGRTNFSFKVAEAALASALYPDIISSDATANTFANAPNMRDLAFVMSKFWNMGMPLMEVFKAVTKTPAKCLGFKENDSSLDIGSTADITILRAVKQKTEFSDSDGNLRQGDQLLAPEMTVLDGRIVYLSGRTVMKMS